jgi:hypothetical protein
VMSKTTKLEHYLLRETGETATHLGGNTQ